MISTRELQPEDDLVSVLTLCKEFLTEYAHHHKEFFDMDNLSNDDISDRFLQSMKSDNNSIIIALIGNIIVGYISVAVHEQPTFYNIKKVGVISGLMIAKAQRRKGIATQLIAEAKAYYHRHDIRYFTVYTAVSNQAAIKFYEQNGMEALLTTFIGTARTSLCVHPTTYSRARVSPFATFGG